MFVPFWCRVVVALSLAGLSWGEAAAEPSGSSACEPTVPGASIRILPRVPLPGEPLKMLAVSADAPIRSLSVRAPDGNELPLEAESRGGPPWSLAAEIDRAARGNYRVEARGADGALACLDLSVGSGAAAGGAGRWDRATEAFFSAWIETLFDYPLDESVNLPSLKPVLTDPSRNFLYDYFGAGEDRHIPSDPDCADLPYYLRAYFAWKVGLPMAYRSCSRGSASQPPRCGAAIIADVFARGPVAPGVFTGVIRKVMDTVHSGSARTGLHDSATDFYPVPLKREYLWPGTVYADPYGHVLVIAKWVPQSANRNGMLLAVDAQPDNSISRKRFWEGTFLFADDVRGAGPGFKAFRPLVSASAPVRIPGNAALTASALTAPFSDEQGELSPEDFYADMGRLINPQGLDPLQAYEAMFEALMEQLETRVASVDNGEAYFRKHARAVIAMPSGSAVFETIGPWEDYSTPSRDMRLIIALNVMSQLPEQVVRHPELFVLHGQSPSEVKARLERLDSERLRDAHIVYHRSDGSPWQLSLAEVFARRKALEVAYNPNDCAEVRWGAERGTEEYSTCTRHAPADQVARMEQYRPWFREARRPPR
ncbi:hypothetical protein [Methylococcus geothermalis]|uniref:Uncharacterized protein n=1 Tax=Methylococcus geothermalis TaxID=2681310 RepID=A0A858QB02_9GAMM|nr:hypothetical protein [Methylococcus geothermalis]QJD31003.1 hypothetical protein GNH96_14310 [Methylococcus geothermalis]